MLMRPGETSWHNLYAGLSAYHFPRRCEFVFPAPVFISFPCALSSATQVKIPLSLDKYENAFEVVNEVGACRKEINNV